MPEIKKIVHEETTTMNPGDNNPTVVAYRVGQLEKSQKEHFDRFESKLEEMVQGFVTEKEMVDAKLEAKAEHDRIWAELKSIRSWGTWLVRLVGAAIILGTLADIGLHLSP